MMSENKYRVASLFAGIGGICLGFKQAGFDIVWANEIDAAACKTYRYNFGSEYLVEQDIRSVKADNIEDFDVLAGGFPCQPFSIAGRQRGFDDRRGNLFFEITRIVDCKRPKIVFLENVPNLMEHDDGKTFLVTERFSIQCNASNALRPNTIMILGRTILIKRSMYLLAQIGNHPECIPPLVLFLR